MEGVVRDVPFAQSLLQHVQKTQYVQIQSYIDERYQDFRSTAVVDDKPEEVVRAEWARDSYYTHLAAFQASQGIPTSAIPDSFSAIVPLHKLSKEDSQRVEDLRMRMEDNVEGELARFLDAKLHDIAERLPNMPEVILANLKDTWLVEHCVEVLEEYVSHVENVDDAWKFVPELKLEDIAEETSREEAAALYEQVSSDDSQDISELVETQFSEDISNLPRAVVTTVEPLLRTSFLQREYIGIVRLVLERAKADMREECVFQPRISPEESSGAQGHEHARALIKQIRPEHVPEIDAEVERRFEKYVACLPKCVRTVMSKEVEAELLR